MYVPCSGGDWSFVADGPLGSGDEMNMIKKLEMEPFSILGTWR
jgi:hypothetical protein